MARKKFIHLIKRPAASLNTAKLARHNSGHPVPVFYHTISDKPLQHTGFLFPVFNKAEFIKHLDFLGSHFPFIDLHELKNLSKPAVHLSFDDGLRECHSVIMPILLKKGIPATFFVNRKFLDNQDLMPRYKLALLVHHLEKNPTLKKQLESKLDLEFNTPEGLLEYLKSLRPDSARINEETLESVGLHSMEYLQNNPVYMTSAEVSDLSRNGFSIGCHGYSHRLFSSLNDSETETECDPLFYQSIPALQSQKIKAFSFPFTDSGVRRGQMAIINKYYDLTFGCAGYLPKKGNHFQRIPVEQSDIGINNLINSEILYGNIKSLITG